MPKFQRELTMAQWHWSVEMVPIFRHILASRTSTIGLFQRLCHLTAGVGYQVSERKMVNLQMEEMMTSTTYVDRSHKNVQYDCAGLRNGFRIRACRVSYQLWVGFYGVGRGLGRVYCQLSADPSPMFFPRRRHFNGVIATSAQCQLSNTEGHGQTDLWPYKTNSSKVLE